MTYRHLPPLVETLSTRAVVGQTTLYRTPVVVAESLAGPPPSKAMLRAMHDSMRRRTRMRVWRRVWRREWLPWLLYLYLNAIVVLV